MPELSVIILTYNEEQHIERAIRSVAPTAAKIFIVDSFSTDRTCEIARALGAEIVQHAYVIQSQQFQWALDTLPISTEWVMRLEADEMLTSDLISEISQRLPQLSTNITGIILRRRDIFMERWIRHGGRYPIFQLRIWRRGAARIELRWIDENMVLLHGHAVTFKHDFCGHNLNDLTSFIRKHNEYATREAIDVLSQKYGLPAPDQEHPNYSMSTQAAEKRRINEKLYSRMPIWLGPATYFFYRYFMRLGFLDGREGLIYHFLQAFWYGFLVAVKIDEFDRSLQSLPDVETRSTELKRLSGYNRAGEMWMMPNGIY